MKIAVLSRGPNLYSTRRLVSVARRRGHRVDLYDVTRVSISLDAGVPRIYDGDDEIDYPDAVIPRIAAPTTFNGLTVLRQFEMAGAVPLNSAEAVARARDKLRCLQCLATKGVPMPDTAFTPNASSAPGALDDTGEGAVVIKLLQGTQGKGVMLARSRQEAGSILDAFTTIEENILVQRFVEESAGRDVRAFVVGREVVACMERRAAAGEFRSNLHAGGTARPIELTRALERIALKATRALGLDVAGVDLLLARDGPVVIEVNACPGLEGIERVTGRNVARKVIDHLETLVDPALLSPRRRGQASA